MVFARWEISKTEKGAVSMTTNDSDRPSDFIRDAIKEDLRTNKFGGRVHTRFPPEPNGYLHIGQAKAICIRICAGTVG